MNKNVLKTKKNLTIIFTIIVSLVIIILGVSFFSAKYYKEISIEKSIFQDLTQLVVIGKKDITDLVKIPNPGGDDFRKKDKRKKPPIQFGSINYITYSGKNILSYNIRENIEQDFLNEIVDIKKSDKVFQTEGFLVTKINNSDTNTIVFKKLKYSFIDYINDLLIFILTTFIFSFLLYFIGNRFVNRAFIPVEENLKDMNNFIHNAGHELKTPISVIDSNIQFVKDIKKYDESIMDEMKNETKKLNSLIDGLIQLSNIGDLKLEKEKINLKDLVLEILSKCNTSITQKNLKVKTNIRKDVFVEASRNYIYILVSNLIGNAVRYNKKDGTINISYKDGELIIKDSGIGMSESDLDKIFDRFYKVEQARNNEGFGIGLSLVKKIADIYKWEIKVESKEGKGSSFIIRF